MCIRGECLNTDGSFMCLCEAGFKFNDDTADCEGTTGGASLLCVAVNVDPPPPFLLRSEVFYSPLSPYAV